MRYIEWLGRLLVGGLFAWQPSAAFDFPQLRECARESRSLEELLGKLPTELRSHYTLVKNSRSQQSASPLAPRVLMFGETAKLIVAFDATGSDLEVAAFDEERNTLEFHQIRYEENKARFSGPNPAECLECHGHTHAKYNWDSYQIWTGLYGEQDDHIWAPDPRKPEKPTPEYDSLKNFLASAPAHPRYRHLVPRPRTAGTLGPYYLIVPGETPSSIGMPERRIENQPNLYLSKLLARNTARILHRRLRESPLYERWRYFLSFSLMTCSRFPKDARTEALWKFFQKDFQARYPGRPIEFNFAPSGTTRNHLRGEVSRLLGVEPREWDLHFEPSVDGIEFFDGNARLNQLVNDWVWKDLVSVHPEKRELWISLRHPTEAYYRDYYKTNRAKVDLEVYRIVDRLGVPLTGPYEHSDGDYLGDGCEWLMDEAIERFGIELES